NPGFETNILNANAQTVRHIAYHTSWPGVDPMNAANPTEVADRVAYYNVSGVPDVVLQGNYKQGGPASMTQADVDAQFSMGSPIKIEVTEVDNGATRDVTVVVKTIGTAPTGTFKLYTAVVEDPIDYTTAPGSNGELHFPNVFRKMYPSTAGENVTLAPVGGAVTFNYTYNVDPTWVAANVKVVSFLQETTSKEVLNVGSVGDPVINYTLSNPNNE
ncbi:MAG: Omp28-related outer membrane protein, partial [Bacteroidia bacterium]